jgi:hypothetical protein
VRNLFTRRALTRITAFALAGVALVWMAYDMADAVRYFREDYRRLWPLAAALIVGVPALLAFRRLSPLWQRRLKLSMLIGLACAMTGYCIYLMHGLWKLREAFSDADGVAEAALFCWMLWGCAGYFWWLVWDATRERELE